MIERLDAASLISVAEGISCQIVRDAVWHGERCNWIGAMPEERAGGQPSMTFRALGPDLYSGTAGIGLFLAELTRFTRDPDSHRTALGALRHALSRVEDLPRSVWLGLYSGRPGMALAFVLAARALEDAELEATARTIASTSAVSCVVGEHDLMSGSAGAIVGLLTLHVLLEDDTLLEAAIRHGEALLDASQRTEAGICWLSASLPDAPGLTGLSHGAAGVAVALLELADVTGTKRYREAADAAFSYERSLYDPAAGNWPDLRRAVRGQAETSASFSTFWCHGAPGGALARLRALELGEDRKLRYEAGQAFETTELWVASALASEAVNYSLCHGLAGNAEILGEADSVFGGSALALAHRVAVAGVERYPSRDLPWPSGAYGGATPCLFLGLAGIGRFYLRLAQPDLPSLLLVRPSSSPCDKARARV
jgi:lantibiotic biosynthesis protein